MSTDFRYKYTKIFNIIAEIFINIVIIAKISIFIHKLTLNMLTFISKMVYANKIVGIKNFIMKTFLRCKTSKYLKI